MPEVGLDATPFTESFQLGKIDYAYPLSHSELQERAKAFEEEYISSGNESVVVGNGEQVIAYSYNRVSPEQAKLIFYKQRIMSTLFQHNFPHFSLSAGRLSNSELAAKLASKSIEKPGKQLGGTVRQRVKTVTNPPFLYPMDEVIDVCSEWRIPFDTDPNMSNILVGADGGEYYVDTLAADYSEDFNYFNAIKYAQANNFSQEDLRILQYSVERISELTQAKIPIAA